MSANDAHDTASWRSAIDGCRRTRKRAVPIWTEARSALGELLLIEFGHGNLSAAQVQRFGSAARIDIDIAGGRPNHMLNKLASLGTSGKWHGNMRSELVRHVTCDLVPNMYEPMLFKLPLLVTKGANKGEHEIDASIVEPHKWMHFLYHTYRSEFNRVIRGPLRAVDKFWSQFTTHDPRRGHLLALARPDIRTKGIPIVLYGDGVPCVKGQSFVAKAWESITAIEGVASTDNIHYIGGYYSHTEVLRGADAGASTKDRIWQPIMMSLLAAEVGLFPDADLERAGEPIAGGCYLVVVGVKAMLTTQSTT